MQVPQQTEHVAETANSGKGRMRKPSSFDEGLSWFYFESELLDYCVADKSAADTA